MAKTTETVLRVRAQNLASKELGKVAGELDHIADVQKTNATAMGLASKALNQLKDELGALQTIARDLNRRGVLAKALDADKQKISETRARIASLTTELERLNAVKAGGEKVKGLGNEIRNVQRKIDAANKDLEKQTKKFGESAASARALGISSEDTAASIKQINVEASRTADMITQAEKAMDSYNDAVRLARQSLQEQHQRQREITAEVERRRAAERAATQEWINNARRLKAELQEQARIREELTRKFMAGPVLGKGETFGPGGDAKAIAAAKAAAAERAQIAAREAALHQRFIALAQRRGAATARLLGVEREVAAAVKNTSAALDRNSSSLDRNHRATGLLADTGRKSLSVYQRLRGQLLSIAAAYIGVFQAANLVRSAVGVEQQRAGIGIQLKIANQDDPVAAARDMKFLRAEADRLGLVFEDVAKNYANYSISAKAAGASTNTVKRSFSQAMEIVTALRLSTDDAEGVFRAFIQIMGKSRVQAEELRGQLGDRLPGAVAAFAKSIGKPLSELDEHLKKGKGTVQEFLKFLEDYNKSVKGSVAESSNTLLSQFNRLKNTWNDFLETFAKAGATTELRKVVDELIKALKGSDGKKFAAELANAFTLAAKAVLFVIQNFDKFILVLKAFLALQVAKAVVDMTSKTLLFGASIVKSIKWFRDLAIATNLAKGGMIGMTFATRAFSLLLGPVGLAIAGVAGAFYLLTKRSREAQAQLDGLINKTKTLRTLQGQAAVAGIKDLVADRKKLKAERDELTRQIAEQSKPGFFNNTISEGIKTVIDRAADTTLSVDGLRTRLAQVNSEIDLAGAAIESNSKRVIKEAAAAKKAAEAAANEQDHFDPPKLEEDDSEDKTAAKLERLAERRRDIADRAARELLDIEKALQDARLTQEETTLDQIDANYNIRLGIIDKEIEKKRIELEGLARDAKALGSADGVASANAALAVLPDLKNQLVEQLQYESSVKRVQLQEKQLNDLIAKRDAQLEHINALVEAGAITAVEGQQRALNLQDAYRQKVLDTIAAIRATLQALPPDVFARLGGDLLLEQLRLAEIQTQKVESSFRRIVNGLAGPFVSGVVNAFGVLAKGIAGAIQGANSLGDAFKGAMNAFREFAADFLVQIGQMILQAILLQAIQNALTGGKGGYTQAVVNALSQHTGGITGRDGKSRKVNPLVFLGAQRFHGGGLPGLKRNEVPTILEKGEEVLTADNPRHINNAGGAGQGGGGNLEVAIHNAIDSVSVLEAAAASPRGKKVIFNIIRADRQAYQKLLTGK